MRARVFFLFHNLVIHPLCGVLWFAGIGVTLADQIHNATAPQE